MILSHFKKCPYVIIILIVMIIWMFINSIQANRAEESLEKEGIFTIGTIKSIKGSRTGRRVLVEFIYHGRIYETNQKDDLIPQSWIGERIIIKFLPSNPIVSAYYTQINIPDSILNIKEEIIWKELPLLPSRNNK